MDYDFQCDFADVFGFDYDRAAAYFGVHRRTILRWYQGYPPLMVKRHVSVMSRGYLPDYAPFDKWRIEGTDIYTPNGKVSAHDVEYSRAYKWQSKQLEARLKNRSGNNKEMLESIERILKESDKLRAKLRRAI